MKKYRNSTLSEYIDALSAKAPVPGGGSAAALSAALGTALLEMVGQYSLGKKTAAVDRRLWTVIHQTRALRRRLLVLVDLDAEAYLGVVKSRGTVVTKQRAALRKAREVPLEVCRLCEKAMRLAPVLVKDGNHFLLSDVEVAAELLLASFNSAMVNVRINQK